MSSYTQQDKARAAATLAQLRQEVSTLNWRSVQASQRPSGNRFAENAKQQELTQIASDATRVNAQIATVTNELNTILTALGEPTI